MIRRHAILIAGLVTTVLAGVLHTTVSDTAPAKGQPTKYRPATMVMAAEIRDHQKPGT